MPKLFDEDDVGNDDIIFTLVTFNVATRIEADFFFSLGIVLCLNFGAKLQTTQV